MSSSSPTTSRVASSPTTSHLPNNGGEENIMTDVTKLNFLEQSNDLIARLPNAAWIAVDEEMTGINLPNTKRPSKDDTPANRYPTLKQVSERYSIIQLGICLFEEAGTTTSPEGVETMKFHVRRYKFTLFPPDDNNITREITFNPSSIHFLAKNNMDFNHMVNSGVPYVTKGNAENLMETFYEKQLQAAKETESPTNMSSPTRRRVQLSRIEDKNFHARSMANLREWLDAAIPHNNNNDQNQAEEGASILLPPCNSFLRRALYESIENEYPNLVVETSQSSQIRVLRLNAQEKKQRKQRLLREGWEKLLREKVGVYRVFLALSKACAGKSAMSQTEHMILSPTVQDAMTEMKLEEDPPLRRKIPLIVHNGLQDLFFLLTHFHDGTLPQTWPEAKHLIHSYFPVIYDTKIMASQYGPRENSRTPTHLSAVYEQTLLGHPHWDRAFRAHDSQEQQPAQGQEQEHDAAWDAYMTGAAFCGLSYTIHDHIKLPATSRSNFQLWNCSDKDESLASMYGRNKLYFYVSPYTIDLESPDSDSLGNGMSAVSTFRVAGIDASVSTRDIIRCLTGQSDSRGDRVNFEIIWIDETTFLAGAMLPNCRDDRLFQEHGRIILQALSDTFRKGETILSLQVSLQESTMTQDEKYEKESSSVWNLWGMLGKTKKRVASKEEEESGRASKRRRIS